MALAAKVGTADDAGATTVRRRRGGGRRPRAARTPFPRHARREHWAMEHRSSEGLRAEEYDFELLRPFNGGEPLDAIDERDEDDEEDDQD
jgi:hypothetical protein